LWIVRLTLPIADLAIVWAATMIAYFLRFQGVVPPGFLGRVIPVAVVASVLFLILFYAFRLYHHVWRYAGLDVVLKMGAAVLLGMALMVTFDVLITPMGEVRPAPIGTLIIASFFVFLGSGGIRFYARVITYVMSQSGTGKHNVLIVGAGDAGSILVRDMRNHPESNARVVAFLDDSRELKNRLVAGVPVVGSVNDLPVVVARLEIDEVYLAIPSATRETKRRVLDLCSSARVKTRVIPQLTGGRPGLDDLRRVEVEDLLGRDSVPVDIEGIALTVADRVVAITGAAGSIGSELCRQIARLSPSRVLLIEIDETRLYETYLEMVEMGCPDPVMYICDIRDDRKLAEIFLREQPKVVIHAAAYKHVPLMELAPDEAVKTNIGGTRNVIAASEACDVERFVLISTDKAVNPSTVMGLTKAIAERLMIDASRRGLRASAVRFGNVLGSRGSVVPLFEEQLRRGGPLRVTHPDVTRYFMTIPEAARLVLQAQAISYGGEIFVLEMGDPVRIVDLAEKMIVLSGADARIEFTGLRPAEKLHEVLVASEESLLPTDAPKINRVSALPIPEDDMDSVVRTLGMLARIDDRVSMKALFGRLMPAFVGHGENMVEPQPKIPASLDGFDSEMETLF